MEREAFLLCFGMLCAVLFHSASAKSVNVTDCGSKHAKIVGLDLSPCDEEPCNFKIGTTVTGILTFTANEYITSGRVKAYAVIDGINIPLPIPVDACEGYGLTCPIKSGETTKIVIKQEIEEGFPQTKLALKGELMDPQGNMVFCFQVPLQISAGIETQLFV